MSSRNDFSNFSLERVDTNDAWDAFVENSPQGSIFSLSCYLSPLRRKAGTWYCLKNEEIKAAVAVMENDDGRVCSLHDLVIYNGIMFAPNDPKQNIAQSQSDQFTVTSFVVQELAKRYQRMGISTAPAFRDIRPFLWHNHGTDGPKFTPDVRYTSLLTLHSQEAASDPQENPIYASASKSRRQEIRYGLKKKVVTTKRFDPDLFTHFYEKTFQRQDLAVPKEDLRELEDLIKNLHQHGRAVMYVTCDSTGSPGSIAIFGTDSKRGYYLYGANDPDFRDAQTGTMVLWDALQDLSRAGVKEVDFEGINSPQRGYFKLSFGGSITPYFHVSL